MEILFAPQGLAKSLKVFKRPGWLAVDKKRGSRMANNTREKLMNKKEKYCSVSMFPNPATPQAFLSAMEETAEV